jgi:hypothetical protein
MKNVFFLVGQKLGKIINPIKRKYQSYKELSRDFQNTKIIQRFTHPFLYKIFAPGVVFFIIAGWSFLNFLNSDTNKSVNIIKQYTGNSKEQEFLNYLNTLSRVDLAYCSMVTARVAWSVIGLKEEEKKFLFEWSVAFNKMGRNKWGETFVGTVEAIQDEVRNMTQDQLNSSLRKCY